MHSMLTRRAKLGYEENTAHDERWGGRWWAFDYNGLGDSSNG